MVHFHSFTCYKTLDRDCTMHLYSGVIGDKCCGFLVLFFFFTIFVHFRFMNTARKTDVLKEILILLNVFYMVVQK